MIGTYYLGHISKGIWVSARMPPTWDLFCIKKIMNSDRIKQLEFQMKNNDLHIQIATMLELTREDIVSKGWNERHDKMLKGIVEDLIIIHNDYKASFRPKTRKS